MGGGWLQAISFNELSTTLVISVALAFLLPFLGVALVFPALRKAKEYSGHNQALQRLKHNPQIFNTLLAKETSLTELPANLGIVLGDPHAKHKIIKVCNPYCGPCAEAHEPMEELLHNNPNVQVQIIFTATNAKNDAKAPPVKHLLAIAEKGDETVVRQALGDWYLPEKKNYTAFASKYPMNGELQKQDEKVEAMQQWCVKTGIQFTPAFFVNGYPLPEMYTIKDLEYFLTE